MALSPKSVIGMALPVILFADRSHGFAPPAGSKFNALNPIKPTSPRALGVGATVGQLPQPHHPLSRMSDVLALPRASSDCSTKLCLHSDQGPENAEPLWPKALGRATHHSFFQAALESEGKPIGIGHLVLALFDKLHLEGLAALGVNKNALRAALGIAPKVNERLSTEEEVNLSKIRQAGLGEIGIDRELEVWIDQLHQENFYLSLGQRELMAGLIKAIGDESTSIHQHIRTIIQKSDLIDEAIDLIGSKKQDQAPKPTPRIPFRGSRINVPKMLGDGHNKTMVQEPEAVRQWRLIQQNGPHTPTIDRLGVDLTLMAANAELNPAVGREVEMLDLILSLNVLKKGSSVIVGPPGTGKTALVEGLATQIVQGQVPSLTGYRLVSISVGSLLSGTQYRGMLEKNIEDIINEAKFQNILIFIDEVHTVVGGGRTVEGSGDIGNYLKAARGVKWIGATTESEYTRIFKKDPALDRRFEKIALKEPNAEKIKEILEGVLPKLSQFHNVTYESGAIDATGVYCDRFVAGHSPDKQITTLDRAGAWAKHHQYNQVNATTVMHTLERHLGIPLTDIGRRNSTSSNVREALKAHVVGQNKAVDTVAKVVFQARMGVNPDRPFVLVFAGPTGTGKTELAKAIAEVDGRHFIEVNLETVNQVSTLKGAEPGYVGHGEEGILTGPQKLHPYSVILFDEMEKAPDEVLKALLGLMDKGEMVDGAGEKVSFKNAIIVFTTNFGANANRKFGLSLGQEEDASQEQDQLAQTIKARLAERIGKETVNRFRNFIVFSTFTPEENKAISQMRLNELAKEMKQRKNIDLRFGEHLVEQIAIKGHDPDSNARQIRRMCDELIRGAVAAAIVHWPKLNDFHHLNELHLELKDPTTLEMSFNKQQLRVPVNEGLTELEI